MVAIVCIILGMGMLVPAAYVLTATLAAPALLEFKFSLMSAHLFIVYFSAISAITPPVAVAAYAAAGISEGDPNATGVQAVRLAVAATSFPLCSCTGPRSSSTARSRNPLDGGGRHSGGLQFRQRPEGYLHGRLRFPPGWRSWRRAWSSYGPTRGPTLPASPSSARSRPINTLSARTILIRSASRSPRGMIMTASQTIRLKPNSLSSEPGPRAAGGPRGPAGGHPYSHGG
ncbi:MAG: TRAP transporter large permease subunit [Bilophila wadsworthia]